MNRQDKIRFLEDLQAGKTSIDEILPPTIRHWYGTDDGIWKNEQGDIISESQIADCKHILNIFHVDCGIPLASCEEEIDDTPYLQSRSSIPTI